MQRYVPSGSLGTSLILIPLVGLPAIIVLSFVYSYISVYSPIVGVITFFVMLAFGYAIGTTISWAGHKAKCRNPWFLRLAGFVGGLMGVYLSWVVFLYALVNRAAESADQKISLLALLTTPLGMWELILAINESGYYTIKSATPTGFVLWMIWGIEALAIIGITISASTGAIENNLYCERCDEWCETVGVMQTDDFEEVDPPERMHVNSLLSAGPVTNTDLPFLQTEILACQRCDDTGGLKITRIKTTNNEGKTKTERVGGMYLLDKESRQRLLAPPQPVEELGGAMATT